MVIFIKTGDNPWAKLYIIARVGYVVFLASINVYYSF